MEIYRCNPAVNNNTNMKGNNESELLNRAFTVMKQEVRENIVSTKGAIGRVEDHQLEDIMVSLREILSPEDFSAVCLLENVDFGHMVYFEALLQKMYEDANETVDPVLIRNLIQIRSTHNSSEVFSFHEADYKLDLCFPDPSLLDVVGQSDDSILEFSDRIQTSQDATAWLDNQPDMKHDFRA
jgi:hypothetical protein